MGRYLCRMHLMALYACFALKCEQLPGLSPAAGGCVPSSCEVQGAHIKVLVLGALPATEDVYSVWYRRFHPCFGSEQPQRVLVETGFHRSTCCDVVQTLQC